jgi:predicted acylesterase/phospholipase RssA
MDSRYRFNQDHARFESGDALNLPFSRLAPALLVFTLAGCVSAMNNPINEFALTETNVVQTIPEGTNDVDTTVIGLAFSGGGTRAAAFSYGLLKGLEATPVPGDSGGRTMLDSVRFISGVSGGSITAAYYGLKGREGYGDFREKFLIRDAEVRMRTSFARPSNLLRAIGGGVNDKSTFGKWLDENVYGGARFSALNRPGAPVVWINASDLYNRTPFIFNEETFSALCSDLNKLPISEAVAASSAVPVVFTPIVLEAYGKCNYHEPGWLETARNNPSAPAALRAFGQALETYRDADKLKYVKLVDGGITDNFGVTGVSLARAASQTPYGPLSPREAVKIKRVVYLVADAGRAPDAEWGSTVKGPGIADLVMAVTDTAISSSVRDGYDAFRLLMDNWQKDLIEYRCSLKQTEVKRLRGTLDGWNCRDLKFFVGTVNFEDVDASMRAELNKVPTRLSLPQKQVDLTIAAGVDALRNDTTFTGALRSMGTIVTAGKDRMVPSAPAAAPVPAQMTVSQ